MNPALYHGVHEEGINTEIILEYYKSVEPRYVYHATTNHIRRDRSKTES